MIYDTDWGVFVAYLPPALTVAREPATSPGDVMELRMTWTPPATAVSSTKVLSRDVETCITPNDLQKHTHWIAGLFCG